MQGRTTPITMHLPGRSGRRPVALLAFLACAASFSPLFALPIKESKLVTFEVRGESVQGHFVRPVAANYYPGVVVIHEWWGLNDQIKRVADRLAGEGFAVIVPDLYRGKLGTDAGWARQYARQLDEGWAVDVIVEAAAWLRGAAMRDAPRPRGQRMPVAIMGFSMGGRLALATALKGKDFQAAVMFYGGVETDQEALRPLHVPLLGIFADEDRDIPKEQVKAFETALKEAGKDATIVVYRGVGQAFFNETRPNYEKDTARIAWERTTQFLKEKLGAPGLAAPKQEPGSPAASPAKGEREPSEG